MAAFTSFFIGTISYAGGVWQWSQVVASALPLLVVFVLFVPLFNNLQGSVERAYVLLAIPMLCAFCLFMVPGRVPDEMLHVYRMLNLGGPWAGPMYAPTVLYEETLPQSYADLYRYINMPADWTSVYEVHHPLYAYLNHLYFLTGIVASIGKALNVNPYVVILLARMVNVVITVVAGYWIIRILPFGKTPAFIFLLNPTFVQQQASCSADVITNIAGLLYAALLVRALMEDRLTKRTIVPLLAWGILFALSKFAYAPLLLGLLLLVPKLDSAALRRRIYLVTWAVMLMACAYLLVFYDASGESDFAYAVRFARKPLEAVPILLRTVREQGELWVRTFGGGLLAGFSIEAWQPAFWLYLVLLVVSAFSNEDTSALQFDKTQRAVLVLLGVLETVLILACLRRWALIHDGIADFISGFQGRYFIPYAIYWQLALVRGDGSARRTHATKTYAILLMMIFACDFVSVLSFF